MRGVFKPSQILNCTVTGSTWHAGGEEHLKAKVKPLHPGALKAIVGQFQYQIQIITVQNLHILDMF